MDIVWLMKESREKVRQAHSELEPVQQQLREKEVELDAAGKELEMLRAETQRWQNRVSQVKQFESYAIASNSTRITNYLTVVWDI